MMQHHKYSLSELDNLIPWEKQIYITMLQEMVKQQNEKMKMLEMQRRR